MDRIITTAIVFISQCPTILQSKKLLHKMNLGTTVKMEREPQDTRMASGQSLALLAIGKYKLKSYFIGLRI